MFKVWYVSSIKFQKLFTTIRWKLCGWQFSQSPFIIMSWSSLWHLILWNHSDVIIYICILHLVKSLQWPISSLYKMRCIVALMIQKMLLSNRIFVTSLKFRWHIISFTKKKNSTISLKVYFEYNILIIYKLKATQIFETRWMV